VIVEGRPLLLDGTLQHIDRDALMQEVAAAAAFAVARRSPAEGAWLAELRRRIAEHYQAPAWHSDSS
jgi:hypothetical protein